MVNRNPTLVAEKCNFKLNTIYNKNVTVKTKKHIGSCDCGTKCSVSYESLRKQKFCRNSGCKYFQAQKRLDKDDMKIIMEERNCETINISDDPGVKALLKFKCDCGFVQENTWLCLYNKEDFCKYYKCRYYYKLKELTVELIIEWFKFENYKYNSLLNERNTRLSDTCVRFNLTCPNNHKFNTNICNWKNGSRCNICKLQQYYKENNCTLIYNENTFPENITVNVIPYVCSYGHLINNLTKNCFNARINQKLDPCSTCSEESSLINRINNIDNILINKNCKLISKNKRRVCYLCSECKNNCYTNDSNITSIKFSGKCLQCTNPFNKKEIQEQIKKTIHTLYGVNNIMHLPEIFKKSLRAKCYHLK